jgi:hypothetical protein
MSDISMLNPGVGINGISTPRTDDISIAKHKGGMSPAMSISGNEQGLEIYNEQNQDSIVDNYLRPKSKDPDLMTPQVFEKTLSGALGKLGELGAREGENSISALSSDIGENNDIVRMFTSLVIPG